MVGQYPSKEKTFRTLLMLDTVRGEHSTGVAIRVTPPGNKRPKTRVAKAEGLPHNLYARFPGLFDPVGNVREVVSGERIQYLMGHNRFATIGALTMDNAHPFSIGPITGAHNGTIQEGLWKLGKGEFNPKGDTDSEKIYAAMANGETLQEIVNKLRGAMALTWFDERDKSFNIFRNSERTLYFVMGITETFVAYASEEWMLKVANSKSKNQELNSRIKLLPVDTHVKFFLSDTGIITSYEVAEVKKEIPKLEKREEGGNVIPLDNKRPAPMKSMWIDRNFRNQQDFERETKCGCCHCSDMVTYQDHLNNKVFWSSQDIFFCEDCATYYGG